MVGGHVKLNGGIKVGTVTKLGYKNQSAHVYFQVTDPNVILNNNTKISIRGAGLLGEKYLLLELKEKGASLTKKSVIEGTEGADLESMMTTADQFVKKADKIVSNQLQQILDQVNAYLKGDDIKNILGNISTASGKLNHILENVDFIVKNLKDNQVDKTFNNLNTTIHSVNTAIQNVDQEIKNISRGIRSLISSTDKGLNKVLLNEDGIMGVTKTSKKTLNNINKLTLSLTKIVSYLDNEDTPLGSLIKNKKVARDLKGTIKNLREITNELKKSPLLTNKREYRPGPF